MINHLNMFTFLTNEGYYKSEYNQGILYHTKFCNNDNFLFSVYEDKTKKHKYGWVIIFDEIIQDLISEYVQKNKNLFNPNGLDTTIISNNLIEEIIYEDFKKYHNEYLLKNPPAPKFKTALKINPVENKTFLTDKFLLTESISFYKQHTNFDKKRGKHKCLKCNLNEAIKSHLISSFILNNINISPGNNIVFKYFPFNSFDCYIQTEYNNPTDLIIATHTTANEYTASYLYCDKCDHEMFENENTDSFFSSGFNNEYTIDTFTKRYIDFLNYKHREMNTFINEFLVLFENPIKKDKINYVKTEAKKLNKIINLLKTNVNLDKIKFFVEIDYLLPFSSMSILNNKAINELLFNIDNIQLDKNADMYCVLNFFRKKSSTIISLDFRNVTYENKKLIDKMLLSIENKIFKFISNCFIQSILNTSEFFLSSDFYNQKNMLSNKNIFLILNAFKNKKYKNKILHDPDNVCCDQDSINKELGLFFCFLFKDSVNTKIINKNIF